MKFDFFQNKKGVEFNYLEQNRECRKIAPRIVTRAIDVILLIRDVYLELSLGIEHASITTLLRVGG